MLVAIQNQRRHRSKSPSRTSGEHTVTVAAGESGSSRRGKLSFMERHTCCGLEKKSHRHRFNTTTASSSWQRTTTTMTLTYLTSSSKNNSHSSPQADNDSDNTKDNSATLNKSKTYISNQKSFLTSSNSSNRGKGRRRKRNGGVGNSSSRLNLSFLSSYLYSRMDSLQKLILNSSPPTRAPAKKISVTEKGISHVSLFPGLLFLFTITTNLSLCSAQKLVYKSHNNPNNPATGSVVIPHITYGQGLNKWSFRNVDRDNHGLHSDILCPNPMISSTGSPAGFSIPNRGGSGGGGVGSGRVNQGGGGGRGRQQQQQQQQQQQRYPLSSSPNQQQHLLPNEIWAVKTDEATSLLPCSLRVPSIQFNGNNNGMIKINTGRSGAAGGTRHHNPSSHFIENRILFMNVSLEPYNFRGAIPCSKYIKLMYDEEEGSQLRCKDIPFDNKHDNKYHINWPANHPKRKDYFSLIETLERFLQNEQTYRRQFYFQIFFTSQFNGRTKRCTVQQYQLDLSLSAGNARYCNLTQQPGGHEELCGEFHCDDLVFPLYTDPIQPHTGHGGSQGGRHRGRLGVGGGGMHSDEEDEEDYGSEEDYDDDDETSNERHHHSKDHHPNLHVVGDRRSSLGLGDPNDFSWLRMLRTDIRLLIFVTIVPLVLFGVLIFGLELIVYFMCCRKRRGEGMEGDSVRSDQLLQNSLNVWENVPSRMDAQRTVSFSPMTTSIYGERKNMQMMDAASLESHPETPKILKSALKKQGEHSSPTTAAHHYFEYDHDMPPSYIETTNR